MISKLLVDEELETVDFVLESLSEDDRTNDKEEWGYKVLKRYNILEEFFGNIDGWKKERGKKNQKAGVDIWVYKENKTIAIDVKVGIGADYSMKREDYLAEKINENYVGSKAGAVELYQYDFFTNTKYKLTDYMLYIIWDNNGLDFYLIDYDTIRKVSLMNRHHFEKYMPDSTVTYKKVREPEAEYTEYESFNGTGIYVKVPMKQIAEQQIAVRGSDE